MHVNIRCGIAKHVQILYLYLRKQGLYSFLFYYYTFSVVITIYVLIIQVKMFAKIETVCFIGLEAVSVNVEISISAGLPCFTIVGLADKAVAESRDRIKSAFNMMGIALPPKRIIVNLSPANIQKEGTHYDLPIAISIFIALGILSQEEMQQYIWLGELSLNGDISRVAGVLPAAIKANGLNKGIVCPKFSEKEASWSGNERVLLFTNLFEIINHFKGVDVIEYLATDSIINHFKDTKFISSKYDFKNIVGQKVAKRCLEIAAAGMHNIIMIGSPGVGKSLLASSLRGILPQLTAEEALETAMIQSISNNGDFVFDNLDRPFRAPHHTASIPSLVGGSAKAKPGEISLAHNGVLFLDEIVEFARNCLDSLRQPIENGTVEIARASMHVTYPAKFQLVAAMNPCPCGYFGETNCSKAPRCAQNYQQKISGPIMDRIDIQCNVASIKSKEINEEAESSKTVKNRVLFSRIIQAYRWCLQKTESENETENQNQRKTDMVNDGITVMDEDTSKKTEKKRGERGRCIFLASEYTNANLSHDILKGMMVSGGAKEVLYKAMDTMNLSMRGHDRILRVARTIADIRLSEEFIKEIKITKMKKITQIKTDIKNENPSDIVGDVLGIRGEYLYKITSLDIIIVDQIIKQRERILRDYITKNDLLEALSYRVNILV